MPRNVVLIVCAALALASAAFSQAISGRASSACSEDDHAALMRVSQQWKQGYNEDEAAKVAALYTEDAYYLTQHFVTGIVKGRAAIQEYVQRGASAHYHVDKIEILFEACSGDFAYTVDRYESTNGGQKAFGVNLVVLKKMGGEWKIVAHEAAVPDPATAIQSLEPPREH